MPRELPYIAAIGEAIHQEMERDDSVLYIGQNIATTDDDPYLKAFGSDRVRVTPISETAEIGMAIGAAMAGYRPVVELYMAEFMLVAMDQVVNEANRFHYMTAGQVKVPVVLKAGYGFTAGWAGQHTGTIYGMFMGVPGLKVALPATPADAKGLMTASIRDDNPVVFFHHYLLTLEHGDVPEGEHVVPLGQANVVREGGDVTIVALGYMLGQALEAAEQLAAEGVQAEVIDPRTLAPLDTATILTSVEKTGRLVVVDQSTRHGSAAAVIAAEAATEGFSSLKAPIQLVTALDATIPYSRADGAVPHAGRGEDHGGRARVAGARHSAGGTAGSPREPPSLRSMRTSAADGCRARHVGRGDTKPLEDLAVRSMSDRALLRAMWRIRAFEERVGQLTRANEVHGLVHLSTGQEAVAVGVCSQLRDDDVVYSGHRAHGHALAKGAPMGPLMAELMGRDTGLCRGLGGSMHLVDSGHGFLGATGVVGGNVPLALGSALAARLVRIGRGRGRLLRRRRGAGRDLRRVGQPRCALAAAGDPRLREQRLRRVHAAFGAHGRRAGQRRGRAVRIPARDRRRQRRPRGPRDLRPVPRGGAREARGRSCSSASPTGSAATTRATRSTTASRSATTSGARSTRSSASAAAKAWRRRRAPRSRRRSSSPAASPFPSVELTAQLVYA